MHLKTFIPRRGDINRTKLTFQLDFSANLGLAAFVIAMFNSQVRIGVVGRSSWWGWLVSFSTWSSFLSFGHTAREEEYTEIKTIFSTEFKTIFSTELKAIFIVLLTLTLILTVTLTH